MTHYYADKILYDCESSTLTCINNVFGSSTLSFTCRLEWKGKKKNFQHTQLRKKKKKNKLFTSIMSANFLKINGAFFSHNLWMLCRSKNYILYCTVLCCSVIFYYMKIFFFSFVMTVLVIKLSLPSVLVHYSAVLRCLCQYQHEYSVYNIQVCYSWCQFY